MNSKCICGSQWNRGHIACLPPVNLPSELESSFQKEKQECGENFVFLDFLLNHDKWDLTHQAIEDWKKILPRKLNGIFLFFVYSLIKKNHWSIDIIQFPPLGGDCPCATRFSPMGGTPTNLSPPLVPPPRGEFPPISLRHSFLPPEENCHQSLSTTHSSPQGGIPTNPSPLTSLISPPWGGFSIRAEHLP